MTKEKINIKKPKTRIPVPQKPPKIEEDKKKYKRSKMKKVIQIEIKEEKSGDRKVK